MTDRLPFTGVITKDHYVAVTAYASPGHLFHADPHIISVFSEIAEAVEYARQIGKDGTYYGPEVHVLARGWGYPDLCSRVWSRNREPEGRDV